MRTIIVLSAIVFTIVGCVKKAEYEDKEPVIGIDPKFYMTQDFNVPIKPNPVTPGQNLVTVITETHEDGFVDTIAITDIPVVIQIPIQENSTKALPGNFNVYYYDSFNNHTVNTAIVSRDLMLLFEDTRRADYDYNDVVLYVKHTITYKFLESSFDLTIKPIANGGSKQGIQFGLEMDTNRGKSTEIILSTDITRDYFNGEKGMNTRENSAFVEPIKVGKRPNETKTINGYNCTIFTDPLTMKFSVYGHLGGYIKYPTMKTTQTGLTESSRSIKYFIKVEGVKYYVALVDKTIQTVIDGKSYVLPYGLAFSYGKSYPIERTPIWMAYPKFATWIETGRPANWDNPDMSGYAIKNKLYSLNTSKLLRW